ncbi:MAG: hypothetical protein D6768_00235 [Chloroflexi bacterium]|nr:MAG: hypothetical protein D6768_00235 [Chloroflexota bacterium]
MMSATGYRKTPRTGTSAGILIAAIFVLTVLGASPAPARAGGPAPLFVLLSSTAGPGDVSQVSAAIERGGGRVTHRFPGVALIASAPARLVDELAGQPGVAGVFTGAVDLAQLDVFGPQARLVGGVWNSLVNPQEPASAQELAAAEHPLPQNDAFTAPDLPAPDDISLAGSSVRPGYYQTSEYMAGSVAVGIVLVESNGAVDPSTEDWTSDEKQLVFTEIVNALNWWAQLNPDANLSFVYDDHFTSPLPTSLEPITRPYWHEYYWISEAMTALGYSGSNYFSQVRDYDNALRTAYNTDWAFTIFVVDSSNDSDNKFSDYYFAYAYLGGPFLVMTSGNNGYGPYNMDAVAAHEMGHIFNALDQYYNAGQSCTKTSGYLNVENQNSQYGSCSSNVSSIMRGQIYPYTAGAIDEYAAGQVGWQDSDADGIPDPLDTQLPLTIDEVSTDEDTVSVSGTAQIVPWPSPTKTDVTINDLTGVQYRIDGGSWQWVGISSWENDNTSGKFSIEISGFPAGQHTLEVAATDSAGNVTAAPASESVTVFDPVDGALNTELYPVSGQVATQGSSVVNGVAYHLQGKTVVGVEYRINGAAWQPATPVDGAFDSSSEEFSITLVVAEGGPDTYLIEARASDSSGYTEVNFASEQVQVAGSQQYFTYMPLVIK